MSISFPKSEWALILGGSSGFGLATAKKLSDHGMSVVVVHRDRKGQMSSIEPEFQSIRDKGVGFLSFNVDALAAEERRTVLETLTERMDGRIKLLLHSVAFGNLKLLAPSRDLGAPSAAARALLAERLGVTVERLTEAVTSAAAEADALSELAPPPEYDSSTLLEEEDFTRTVHAMGTSLAAWTQDILARGLFTPDARVLGMTSEGNEVAWRGYAAVSAAKAALEAVSRAMALELAPHGIRANVVQAGVTDTRALRLIPGSERLKAAARRRNPFGRLTTPSDVADVICLLCTHEARWINGTIVRVDGGEHIAG